MQPKKAASRPPSQASNSVRTKRHFPYLDRAAPLVVRAADLMWLGAPNWRPGPPLASAREGRCSFAACGSASSDVSSSSCGWPAWPWCAPWRGPVLSPCSWWGSFSVAASPTLTLDPGSPVPCLRASGTTRLPRARSGNSFVLRVITGLVPVIHSVTAPRAEGPVEWTPGLNPGVTVL